MRSRCVSTVCELVPGGVLIQASFGIRRCRHGPSPLRSDQEHDGRGETTGRSKRASGLRHHRDRRIGGRRHRPDQAPGPAAGGLRCDGADRAARRPRHRSLMPQVIGRQSRLPVTHAEEGTDLEPCHVYLAPHDRHMLIKRKGTLTLTDTELVNFVRPSADLMFESVAAAYGDRAIAIVLTGTGHDGAMGVTAIKKRGGTVVAQDEASSEFFGMPSSAIKTGAVDMVLPLDEIAPKLVALLAR